MEIHKVRNSLCRRSTIRNNRPTRKWSEIEEKSGYEEMRGSALKMGKGNGSGDGS